MPEIVEVYNDSLILDDFYRGRYITSITLLDERFRKNISGFGSNREGEKISYPLKIDRITSRAKKVFFFLKDKEGINKWIVFTYGMSGKLTIDKNNRGDKYKNCHIEIALDRGVSLYYINSRRIGYFYFLHSKDDFIHQVNDMGKPIHLSSNIVLDSDCGFLHDSDTGNRLGDKLEKDDIIEDGVGDGYEDEDEDKDKDEYKKQYYYSSISFSEFQNNIKNPKLRNKYLVSCIMDQRSICSGIGNYLLSEIMFQASLYPEVKCGEMSDDDISTLWTASREIIRECLEKKGASVDGDRFSPVDEDKGYYKFKVYGKEGETINGKLIKSMKGKHSRTIWYV